MAKAEAKPQEVEEDDRLFWSFVVEVERPTTLHDLEDCADEQEEAVESSDASLEGDFDEVDTEDSFDLDEIYF